jgi:hypothetical protein
MPWEAGAPPFTVGYYGGKKAGQAFQPDVMAVSKGI